MIAVYAVHLLFIGYFLALTSVSELDLHIFFK